MSTTWTYAVVPDDEARVIVESASVPCRSRPMPTIELSLAQLYPDPIAVAQTGLGDAIGARLTKRVRAVQTTATRRRGRLAPA